MGKSSTFDRAIAAFAEAYAAQNLEDFAALRGCHRIRPSRGRRADVTSTALEARGRSRWARVDKAGARAFAVPRHPHRFRRSTDAILLALSVVVLLVTGARIDQPIGSFEAAVGSLLESFPLVLQPVWQIAFDLVQVWALFLIALSLLRRRWGLARDLAVVIAVVTLGAMVTGRLATGDWPDLLAGLGPAEPPADFPSLALAGSTAAVAVAAPYLARPLRHTGRWLVGLGAISGVALGLVAPGYVLGALSLGWGAAAVTHLVVGSPSGAPPLREVRRALLAMGLEAEPHAIEPVGGRMRARATLADGTELDIDIHSRDAWDSQLVVKLWRWLWYRSDGPDVAVTRRQQMEHQAFVTLLAERRGATVAPVIAAAIDARGDALLVSEHVGVALSDPTHQIDDVELAACWVSLAKLGDAGIRHGAITTDHLRVVGDVVYLSDLDRAKVGSDDESRRLDEAQLLITTALLVGPERATAAALDALGPERLAAVTSFVQPAALTPVMRKAAAAADLDIDDFRKAVVAAAGGEEQEIQQLRRFSLGGVITGVLLLIVAVTMVSAIEEIGIETIVDSVQAASLPILLLAFVIGQTPRVANAAALAAAAPIRLPFARLTLLQFAITFVNLADAIHRRARGREHPLLPAVRAGQDLRDHRRGARQRHRLRRADQPHRRDRGRSDRAPSIWASTTRRPSRPSATCCSSSRWCSGSPWRPSWSSRSCGVPSDRRSGPGGRGSGRCSARRAAW